MNFNMKGSLARQAYAKRIPIDTFMNLTAFPHEVYIKDIKRLQRERKEADRGNEGKS